MSFAVDADAYDRFMGRYSSPLATEFCAFVGVAPGQRVLDVGCGPGAFVAELVTRVGADGVAAVDPSPTFVAAVRARFPGVDVRAASAEDLPFRDDTFSLVCAQLVVQLAVNKQGVIRGNSTDTTTGETQPVQGSVDLQSQRVAFTIGDNSTHVFETGLYNLTKDEAPALLHAGSDSTEQWLLVRLQQPAQ